MSDTVISYYQVTKSLDRVKSPAATVRGEEVGVTKTREVGIGEDVKLNLTRL